MFIQPENIIVVLHLAVTAISAKMNDWSNLSTQMIRDKTAGKWLANVD
jgi:hypothetical protein